MIIQMKASDDEDFPGLLALLGRPPDALDLIKGQIDCVPIVQIGERSDISKKIHVIESDLERLEVLSLTIAISVTRGQSLAYDPAEGDKLALVPGD